MVKQMTLKELNSLIEEKRRKMDDCISETENDMWSDEFLDSQATPEKSKDFESNLIKAKEYYRQMCELTELRRNINNIRNIDYDTQIETKFKTKLCSVSDLLELLRNIDVFTHNFRSLSSRVYKDTKRSFNSSAGVFINRIFNGDLQALKDEQDRYKVERGKVQRLIDLINSTTIVNVDESLIVD